MNLAQLIDSKGLTAAQVARRSRLSERTIYNAKLGRSTTESTVYWIAVALDADVDVVRDAIARGPKGQSFREDAPS